MEIKTCEQYILAELEAIKTKLEDTERKLQTARGQLEVLNILKEIFVVKDGEEGLDIGVNEEVLNLQTAPGALQRIMVLKNLFQDPGERNGDSGIDKLVAGIAGARITEAQFDNDSSDKIEQRD